MHEDFGLQGANILQLFAVIVSVSYYCSNRRNILSDKTDFPYLPTLEVRCALLTGVSHYLRRRFSSCPRVSKFFRCIMIHDIPKLESI